MNLVAKYWFIMRLVWIERMAYRINFLMEVGTGILSSLILIFLWMAIYRSAGRGVIGGYSVEEMVTYLLGAGLINSFILTTAENPETSQSIQDGTLSALLIKPICPYLLWFTRDLGSKAFLFLLGVVGYLIVFFFMKNSLLGFTGLMPLSFFLSSLILASLLQFLLFEALSLLSFWVENTYGIRFTVRVIMEVVGGAIIPLSFFPQILQQIFLFLPFPYLIYIPMQFYLGKIPNEQIPLVLLREGGWIVGLAMLNWVLWGKGIKQYVSMGD